MAGAPRLSVPDARAVVVLPLVVLTIIFGIGSGLLLFGESLPRDLSSTLLVSTIAVYAAAVALLYHMAMGRIADLEGLSLTDSLSFLPNRRALHADVGKGNEDHGETAVALIDLDGFKMVNDLYGHAIGDRLIRRVAEELVEVCGDEARAYRLGGDEFAMSASGPLAGTILEGICRSLIERFGSPFAIDERRIAVGASIGLSRSTTADPHASSELLRRADVAMYVSKRGGRMRCTWFQPDFDRDLEAMRDMDGELRDALLNEEFRVHYQPLVDAQSGRVVAVESLIRWERPDGKRIGPNIFIPIAEESGLINAIGLWVLRRACMDALPWDDVKLSVNISAAQLRNAEFPIQLGNILEETGFPPERLELEITETCLVLDPAVAERSLGVIRGFGVNIALDDFGTGYASIGFLRQFRFEKLKLDRSLVVDATNDESSRAMMLSSVSMARALKMNVTAEGVETEDQADMVRTAGCDQIQGWLYFKPMPAEDIAQHLTELPVSEQSAEPERRKA